MFEFIYLFFAALLAYIIKGITGFGNTLIMAPLFNFVLDSTIVTPIDLLFSIPINSFIVYKNRKNLSLKTIIPLSIMVLIGVIPGAFLLESSDATALKIILGIVTIGIAIELSTRRQNINTDKKPNPILLTIIGVASGVLAGLYGIAVLLVAYISRTTSSKGQFRANLCAVFLIDNFFRMGLYTYKGSLMTYETLKLALYLFPAVIIGMFIGIKVDKRLNDKMVNKFVIILLIVSGISLIVTNLIN
ncbi:MAG: hypothetical protein K0Q49_1652 [Haloplasmataceae bacterium]|jgi:uncharacterized membrane protein YfcA|nr:hypothetical protein [Haloplasmataceae bacterium]